MTGATPNRARPDCGWDPGLAANCTVLQQQDINASEFDVTNLTNVAVTLTSALQISDITGMLNGKVYKIVAYNTGSNTYDVTMPSDCWTTSAYVSATPTAGSTVVVSFWTDGTVIYADKSIYTS